MKRNLPKVFMGKLGGRKRAGGPNLLAKRGGAKNRGPRARPVLVEKLRARNLWIREARQFLLKTGYCTPPRRASPRRGTAAGSRLRPPPHSAEQILHLDWPRLSSGKRCRPQNTGTRGDDTPYVQILVPELMLLEPRARSQPGLHFSGIVFVLGTESPPRILPLEA